ncbi:MAG: hypothetical protein GX552_04805 [Chloroflexi bacterium]|jgi:uncharacterized protein involved in exopolysaccharide biosynthesis|nr:hypothetical protein [Chloroflexota bacterium]
MQAAADFIVYLNIIRKRLWLTALLFLVTVGVILAVTITAKPVYRASVRLQVLATDRSDVSLFSTYRSSTIDEITQAQNDFIRALKSGFVAWKTIADLNLDIGALDLVNSLTFAVEGDFILVTAESDDPGTAEAIATTQVNNALANYREVRATPSRVLREFVSGLLEQERENMLKAEEAVLEFKRTHGLESVERETLALQEMVRSLKLERDRTVIELDRNDTFAQVYREQQQAAQAKANEIAASAADADASGSLRFYQDLARQHEARALDYEATREGYERSLEIYDQMIEDRTEEMRNLLTLGVKFNALERDLSRATSNYNFLWDRENEARLKQLQAEELGYIQIIEPARKPDEPVPSKTMQWVMVGGVVSILVGFLLSFVIEFLGAVGRAARQQPEQRPEIQPR